ncbi:MBL fold metallo-hydrolase [Vibrio aphrogenes]|uniref:MBL fold metallo-hydrolase n=1 Tax=Vibrio aphrogenes TaxID=1891186 RepID=UPI000B353DF3|nr:MBL fold metallo-hydrolase [Vibrio aphrogenes]
MSLKYQSVPVTPFQQNCSIVWCDQTMKGVIVDPGGEVNHLITIANTLGVTLEKIVLTHGHLDHVGGTPELTKELNLPVIGPHIDDAFWLQGLMNQSQMFGFPPIDAFEPTKWLQEGDKIEFGDEVLDVIHTPGHTPGHVVLYSESANLAFVGDVLFNGAIGRTDFPKGDYQTLINSIKQKLWPLGNEVRFIPGHGPESTFGQERKTNPFVADEMPLY